MQIRTATIEDCEALLNLRNYYIAETFAVFDEQPLTLEFVQNWVSAFSASGPHRLLVAEDRGLLLGFACSQRYRDHPAFRRTIETSIYVAPGNARQGVGSALYSTLFSSIEDQDLHRALVGIALPNEASIGLHKKFGFTEVGVFDEYATKNGQYISSVWLQRHL